MALRQYHKLQLVRGLLALPSCSPTTLSGSPTQRGATLSPRLLPQSPINDSGNYAAATWLTSAFRAYHNIVGGLDLPSRRGLFAELPVVSDMLPNRKLLAAQFSPHGLTLVPKAILDAAAASSTRPVPTVQEPSNPMQQAPMQAIGIKTWRRLKMKKHKIRKRRKDSRMQVKKN